VEQSYKNPEPVNSVLLATQFLLEQIVNTPVVVAEMPAIGNN